MGDNTGIEWTDATWNPTSGCSKVSQGCKNCYAERVFSRPYPGRRFTDVQVHAERLAQPIRWKRPRRIFVNSMSDLFHELIPFDFIDRVFAAIALSPQHTFQILTKRPQRMLDYMTADDGFGRWGYVDGCARQLYAEVYRTPFPRGLALIQPPRNVHLGVSVEDQDTADERIPLLRRTPAAVRFLSAEPLLGAITLIQHLGVSVSDGTRWEGGLPAIDWIIAGGESGPRARPAHPEWIRSLRDQCVAAAVPFHFKQWGEWWPISQMPDGVSDMYFDPKYGSGKRDECDTRPAPRPVRTTVLQLDGTQEFAFPAGAMTCFCVGKKAAGRALDGAIWNQFPGVAP